MAEQGPLSGQKLGDKYVLGELLGQGGFGVVYQAKHLLLNRQQAVKILLEQHFASPKFRERFLREAQTLAALDHPNIVHVDDFGFEGTRAYLVMPYISGGNLQRILQREPLPVMVAAHYLEQICAALDYAHARDVAHLDLKPLNLLLHEDGRLLLSDFGLAHLMEQGAIEGSTSLQFGTPAYMAPEHLQGQPERRSDLYALGILLYQMLVGRVPFEGSNAAAIMLKHLNEPPPPLHASRPDLPPALEGVLTKALAKNPAVRYQSAGRLFSEFRNALGGQGSNAYATTRPAQFYRDTTLRAGQPPAQTAAPQAKGVYAPTVPLGPRPETGTGQLLTMAADTQESAKSSVSGNAVASFILGMVAQVWATSCVLFGIISSLLVWPYPGGYNLGHLVVSLLSGLFAFLPGIAAVELGKRARKQIRSSNGRLRGNHLAAIGFWLGYLVYGVLIFQLLISPARLVRWLLKD